MLVRLINIFNILIGNDNNWLSHHIYFYSSISPSSKFKTKYALRYLNVNLKCIHLVVIYLAIMVVLTRASTELI